MAVPAHQRRKIPFFILFSLLFVVTLYINLNVVLSCTHLPMTQLNFIYSSLMICKAVREQYQQDGQNIGTP
jgi:hypothetical protein